MSEEIFEANYQNKPIDKKGRLYTEFALYEQLPTDAAGVKKQGRKIAYTDTADTGADFMCCIVADVIDGQGYVTDVVYTDEPMEITEPLVARTLYNGEVEEAVIESNNGGRGFARNVKAHLWNTFHSRRTVITDLNQRANKESRILSEATWVMHNLLFPADWGDRWPRFFAAMVGYMTQKTKTPAAVTPIAQMPSGFATEIVELPGWEPDQTVHFRLRRSNLRGLVTAGKIPNPLLSAAQRLYEGGSSKSNASFADIVKVMYDGPSVETVTVAVDGNAVPAAAVTNGEVNLIPYLGKDDAGKVLRGNHTITLTPVPTDGNAEGLCAVTGNVSAVVFIRSQGGGDY